MEKINIHHYCIHILFIILLSVVMNEVAAGTTSKKNRIYKPIRVFSDSALVKDQLAAFGQSADSRVSTYSDSKPLTPISPVAAGNEDGINKLGIKVRSITTRSIRTTLGTSTLNAIHIKVTDSLDKPISGLDVEIVSEGGIAVTPGWLNGKLQSSMKTNEDGEFAVMLTAEANTTYIKTAGERTYKYIDAFFVAPTIDELGSTLVGKPPYQVSINIANKVLKYDVDVDMGPSLVIKTDTNGLEPGYSQWVGKVSKKPVQMTLIYMQRTADCSAMQWWDYIFLKNKIQVTEIQNLPYTVEAKRVDGNSNHILISNSHDDVEKKWLMSAFVTMDNVRGNIDVTYKTQSVDNYYFRNNLCFDDGALNIVAQPSIDFPPITVRTGGFSNTIPLISHTPTISIELNEHVPPEPENDPHPGIKSYSGLDLAKLIISLNERIIFGGAIQEYVLHEYPNYMEVHIDNKNLEKLEASTLKSISPYNFKFIYYPVADDLNLSGENFIDLLNTSDRVGNKSADERSSFILP